MTHRIRLIVDLDCAGPAEATAARDRIWDSLRYLAGIEHLAITEVPGPAEARARGRGGRTCPNAADGRHTFNTDGKCGCGALEELTPAADATEAEQRATNETILGVDDES